MVGFGSQWVDKFVQKDAEYINVRSKVEEQLNILREDEIKRAYFIYDDGVWRFVINGAMIDEDMFKYQISFMDTDYMTITEIDPASTTVDDLMHIIHKLQFSIFASIKLASKTTNYVTTSDPSLEDLLKLTNQKVDWLSM